MVRAGYRREKCLNHRTVRRETFACHQACLREVVGEVQPLYEHSDIKIPNDGFMDEVEMIISATNIGAARRHLEGIPEGSVNLTGRGRISRRADGGTGILARVADRNGG